MKTAALPLSLALCVVTAFAEQPRPYEPGLAKAVNAAMHNSGGSAIVLDIESDRILAADGLDVATRRLATPGSTLKPFFLLAAMDSGAMPASQGVFCRKSLRIAGRRVDCTHPAVAHALEAREALAYSCNAYFVEMAGRLYARRGGEEMANILRVRIAGGGEREHRGAARGFVRSPRSVAQAQLLALGVDGIEVSPIEVAGAYRGLAMQLTQADATAGARVVAAGLEDAVRYGMADSAAVAGMRIAGKTGTASEREAGPTHGWFAGYALADRPQIVVVVWLPHGHGADAARRAAAIFAAWHGQPA